MTGLFPPAAREIRLAVSRLKRATTRAEVVASACEAASLVKQELTRTERKAVVALTKVKVEREELLELLRTVNEALKEKLDELTADKIDSLQ